MDNALQMKKKTVMEFLKKRILLFFPRQELYDCEGDYYDSRKYDKESDRKRNKVRVCVKRRGVFAKRNLCGKGVGPDVKSGYKK